VLVCKVLGATEVEADGVRLELGGPFPRRLLTALIAAQGQLVPDERLAEAVWGADAPVPAAAVLRVHVSRLRRALGNGRRELLERQSLGYRLRLSPDATDAERFARSVEQGRKLLADGDAASALRVLTEALTLWRGEPYADLPASPVVEAARGRLEELREVAVDERLAARLATGEAALAVSELGAAVQASPYRERRWALLILGLYRTGRQADALATLRRVRALLAEELGIDPGAELQELERRVLGQDPYLMLPEMAEPQRQEPGRPLSSFLGRDGELRSVAEALAQRRLVTVVGPAGVGKTRLIVEYGTDYRAQWSGGDGPWLARLADVAQPEVLAQAVADAIGLAEVTGDPRATLIRALAARPGLLMLDNCEHLVDVVAELAIELLGGCPGLRILATSREPLGVDGEAIVPLHPLPLEAEDGSDGPAVTLLLDRVRAVRAGWTPTAEESAKARQICAALDGLPLALELAAARARVLGLAEIAERLDDRFSVLGAVPRGSLTAHATLHAAIEWSVEQLPDPERALLFRLWPFEGGFSLEAAEAVRPSDASMIESMSTLVARSVVIADTTMEPTRYRLLETLRAYCREHDPDPTTTQEAHARWARELVARYLGELNVPRDAHVPRMLRRELPNLRAGIRHDLAAHPEAALRTVGPLDRFWINGGHLDEGRQLLDAALRAAPGASSLHRGRASLALASLSALTGDFAAAGHHYAEAIALATASNDHDHRLLHGRVLFQSALGAIIYQAADPAMDAAERAIDVGEEVGDDWMIASGQTMLGAALVLQGRPEDGQAMLTKAAELAERGGIIWTAGCAQLFLGWAILRKESASRDPEGHALEALVALCRALTWFQQLEDDTFSLTALNTGATAMAVAGQSVEAARLRAAVHHHSARLGMPEDYLRRLGAMMSELPPVQALSPADQARAEADGAQLTWSAMLDLLPASTRTLSDSAGY
jgi:predicted ATPase/DNA-binding SARP family transcriptional activator